MISRIVQDQDVAEEVLQDAFMRYWDKIDQYNTDKGRLFSWMMRITRNLALDKLRSRGMKQQSKSDSISVNVYTLEPQDDSESPTLDAMYVLGEV